MTSTSAALSAISAGHYYLMRKGFCPDFYCPTVIGFAASLVEEIKEIKEIFVPTREAFLLFLLFLRETNTCRVRIELSR